jgi:hypothetical protein
LEFWLYPAMKEFKLDTIIDRGPNLGSTLGEAIATGCFICQLPLEHEFAGFQLCVHRLK